MILYGTFIPYLPDEKNLMAFYRKSQENTLLVIANFSTKERVVELETKVKNVVLNNTDSVEFIDDTHLRLKNYQVVILEVTA